MEIYFLLFSHQGLGTLVGHGGWVANSEGGGRGEGLGGEENGL